MTRFGRLLATVGLCGVCHPSLSRADPPKGPDRVPVAVGETTTFTVTADKAGKPAAVAAFDQKDCVLVRLYSDSPDEMVFLVIPKKPGEYRLVLWTAGETRGAQVVVTATGAAPPANGGHSPTAFEARVKAAHALEAAGDRALVGKLADVYEAFTSDSVLAQHATWGALSVSLTKMGSDRGVAGPDVLPHIKAVIAVELKSQLPWQGASDQALDAAGRSKAKSAFATVARALRAL